MKNGFDEGRNMTLRWGFFSTTAAPCAREDICGFTAFNDTPKALALQTCSLPALLPVLLFFLTIHDFIYLFIFNHDYALAEDDMHECCDVMIILFGNAVAFILISSAS